MIIIHAMGEWPPAASYRPRLIAVVLATDLEAFPAVVVTGARQAGKSTFCRESEAVRGLPYVSLDDSPPSTGT